MVFLTTAIKKEQIQQDIVLTIISSYFVDQGGRAQSCQQLPRVTPHQGRCKQSHAVARETWAFHRVL